MTDIFISYSSADRERAKQIAEDLSEQGWSVWWDREILPGTNWDKAIEQALNTARCVLVLWSKSSAQSDWVKNEAAEGARRKVLVPAMIDPVTIPLEFRRVQAADLSKWDGDDEDIEYQKLLSAINAELTQDAASVPSARAAPLIMPTADPAAPSGSPVSTTWGPAARKRRIRLMSLALGLTGLVVLGGAALMGLLAKRNVDVPDVRGKTENEALVQLAQLQLQPVLPPRPRYVVSEDVGKIIEHNPRGVKTPRGTAVELWVGAAPSVPVLGGLTVDRARALLLDASLTLGEHRTEESEQPAGTVIRQSPAGGASTSLGMSVDLVVATVPLPSGSYRNSCNGARVQNDTLSADCMDVQGRAQPSRLERIGTCEAQSISNENGVLACKRSNP